MMIGGRESERDHMVDVFLCCSVVGMVGSWLVGVAALSNQETGGKKSKLHTVPCSNCPSAWLGGFWLSGRMLSVSGCGGVWLSPPPFSFGHTSKCSCF